MKKWIGAVAVLVLLTGCGDFKAKIAADKKAKALKQCIDFAKKETRDTYQHAKIIDQCMETSGYYGYKYDLQGK